MMRKRSNSSHFRFIACIMLATISYNQAFGLFTYDRAVQAGHQGNWPYANGLLNQLVVDDPKNPSKVYDAGVASYKLKDYKQSEAYFNTAQEMARNNKELQEKALFNQGNAQAQQKKLKEAIASYEAALAIKPDDARAHHNLELVKKMLEQEQKQQENKHQQDQKDKKQQEQDKQKEQQNKEDGAQSENQQSSDQDKQKQDKDQQEKDSNKNNAQNQADQKKHNQDQGNREQSEKNQQEKDQKQQQEELQSNAKQKQNGQSQAQAEEKSLKNDMAKKIDAHLAQLLDQREQRDGELNKQFIKAQVGKQLTGHHGQNCW
jgi:Ca-activated chloride channel homolog